MRAPARNALPLERPDPPAPTIFREVVEAEAPAHDIEALLTPGAAMPIRETDIAQAAAEVGCDVAALKAVMQVEAAGKGFRRSGFPKIRPEVHVFHRHTGGAHQRLRFVSVSSPEALFEQLLKLDVTAALKATSFGVGQIMGFNYGLAGCESVEQLAREAKESGANQLAHMVAFLRATGLDGHLRAQDWERFAAGYNGPQWRRNDYAGKLERSYQRIAGRPSWMVLRFGARGPAVERLQRALTAAGYHAVDDGHFSAETEASLRAFQSERGLEVDGVAGTRTWEALALVEEVERSRDVAPPAPPPPDTTLDELTKVGGAVGVVGSATSGGGILAWVFGATAVALVGFFLWRKFKR